ncbi:hypothetical protein ACSSS7_006679 [Eimeria intestinalis]
MQQLSPRRNQILEQQAEAQLASSLLLRRDNNRRRPFDSQSYAATTSCSNYKLQQQQIIAYLLSIAEAAAPAPRLSGSGRSRVRTPAPNVFSALKPRLPGALRLKTHAGAGQRGVCAAREDACAPQQQQQ